MQCCYDIFVKTTGHHYSANSKVLFDSCFMGINRELNQSHAFEISSL